MQFVASVSICLCLILIRTVVIGHNSHEPVNCFCNVVPCTAVPGIDHSVDYCGLHGKSKSCWRAQTIPQVKYKNRNPVFGCNTEIIDSDLKLVIRSGDTKLDGSKYNISAEFLCKQRECNLAHMRSDLCKDGRAIFLSSAGYNNHMPTEVVCKGVQQSSKHQYNLTCAIQCATEKDCLHAHFLMVFCEGLRSLNIQEKILYNKDALEVPQVRLFVMNKPGIDQEGTKNQELREPASGKGNGGGARLADQSMISVSIGLVMFVVARTFVVRDHRFD